MNRETTASPGIDSLIRIGGLGGFLSTVLYFLINYVVKELPPPETTPIAEFQAYLTRAAGSWGVAHGLRYATFFLFALFAAGLFSRVRTRAVESGTAWGVLGLLGAGLLLAIGTVTNTIETFLFFDHERISQSPDFFWLLYVLTRFLFSSATLSWGLVTLGFGIATLLSRALPRGIALLGVVAGAGGILSAVFLVVMMRGGWAEYVFAPVALFGTLAWLVASGIVMMLRGSK